MNEIKAYRLKLIKETSIEYNESIERPEIAVDIINKLFDLGNRPEETVVMLALNIKNNVIGAFIVSIGNLNTSILNGREVFKRAMLCNAAAIIIAHNHPSGHLDPSKEDIKITKRFKQIGELLEIPLLDHLIISENNYLSIINSV